jgi:tetratricopeptide (TPR) repeat protein
VIPPVDARPAEDPRASRGGGAGDAGNAVSRELFRIWTEAPAAELARIHEFMTVPGQLSLRSRFETIPHLLDSPLGEAGRAVTWETWTEQLDLLASGDDALRRQQPAVAQAAFEALRRTHREGAHPLPLIEAEHGLADVARQRDQPETALGHYRRAIGAARKHRCEFADVRAGLALAYTELDHVSAARALSSFTVAATKAGGHDWRLDRANALVGVGECHTRLADFEQAEVALAEAFDLFAGLRSAQGLANTAQQRGELARRTGRVDDAHRWYSSALEHAEESGAPLTTVNALDGLAEIELELDHVAAARRLLGRAARISATSYPRGLGHALTGLARCSYRAGNLATAIRYFEQARTTHESIGIFTAAATASAGIAASAERLGEPAAATQARLEAVRLVEESRAGQIRHADQGEYLTRFGQHHFAAMRACLVSGSIDGFVATFEAVAGRRLAGLIESDEKSTRAALLAQLARLSHESRAAAFAPDPGTVPDSTRDHEDEDEIVTPSGKRVSRHLARRIGAIALSSTLPGMARGAIDDVIAESYKPFDLDGAWASYEAAVTDRERMLLIVEDQQRGEIIWLAVNGIDQPPHGGVTALSDEVRALLDRLESGLDLTATLADLAPLAVLVPDAARRLFEHGERTTIVPAGRLWRVPWGAIPLIAQTGADDGTSPQLLVEAAPLLMCPTVSLAARSPGETADGKVRSVGWWRSRQVRSHHPVAIEQAGAVGDVRALDAGEVRSAVTSATDDMVVLVAHGRPQPALVHYIDLDDSVPLTPADLLGATTPRLLVLIACWGAASPQSTPGDPLSIVTLALTRTTHLCAATTSELRDDALADRYVNMFLQQALDLELPEAVHAAATTFLARDQVRSGYVSRWAPLVAIG